MDIRGKGHDQVAGFVRRGGLLVPDSGLVLGQWECEARDPNGKLLWRDGFKNLIVNEGLSHMLGLTLDRSTSPAITKETTWYIGLLDGTASPLSSSIAAGDTMSSHSGWTELTGYSQANRPAFTDGGESGQSIDNSASKATFSITASPAVGFDGAFLVANNTKGGSTGTLFSAGLFASTKTLSNGDTLDVQGTFSVSSS